MTENKFSYDFTDSPNQGCANLHVSNHSLSHEDYKPINESWLKWIME